MKFYKILKIPALICIISVFAAACSSSDEDMSQVINLKIISFEPSYGKVEIKWQLDRPNNAIIQDMFIYRTVIDEDSFSRPELIANLPSNEITYIDENVPYMPNVSYYVKINYFVEKEKKEGEFDEIISLESEAQLFSRAILQFDRVPLQVEKDSRLNNVFYILDKSDKGELLRYDSELNTSQSIDLFNESVIYLDNVFQIVNEKYIYLANSKGNLIVIDINDYSIVDTYQLEIRDRLRSFSIDSDRIYYSDDGILHYFDITNKLSHNLGWGYFPSKYMETLAPNKTLFIGGGADNAIVELSKDNCPDSNNCFPEILLSTGNISNDNRSDPFLFSWNQDKSKFVSSYFADVYDINDLSRTIRLSSITNKNYFQAIFDEQGNIYAAVQGEKLIHVFNTKYELINKIQTKLYPIFPMLTSKGICSLGTYKPINYWGYIYGHEFNFSKTCAIEIIPQ